jgi:putative ABC transport system permease protein
VKTHLEYLKLAFDAIISNKLRSFLSVLGITIGIFCIVMVFTAVSSLEKHVKSSVESFGTDVIFIQKWPWTFGGDYPWWKYYRRPRPTHKNFELLEKKLKGSVIQYSSFVTGINDATIVNQKISVNNVSAVAISHDYRYVQEFELEMGRYFSDFESGTGVNVAVIGNTIAENLGIAENDLGQVITINRIPARVIGILKKQGDNLLGKNNDDLVFVPHTFLNKSYNLDKEGSEPSMMLKVKDQIPLEEAKAEVRGILRSLLKLKVKEEDNFSINQISMLTANLSVLFTSINIAGLLIGIFSVMVGGFGVANIMFVSVKERTNLIGIQKALGAKKSFIQNQFIAESVMLCIIGGLLGILLVYSICLLANFALASGDNTFRMILSIDIFLSGVFASAMIGILAGYFPANKASKMLPVDAIRSKG